MATCPRCKGHLTDWHRCPRRPVLVALEVALAAIAGGFAGLLIVSLFDLHGQIGDTDTLFVVLGAAVVGVAVNRLFR